MIVFKEKPYSDKKSQMAVTLFRLKGLPKKDAIRVVAATNVKGSKGGREELWKYAKREPGSAIGAGIGTVAVPLPVVGSAIGSYAGMGVQRATVAGLNAGRQGIRNIGSIMS